MSRTPLIAGNWKLNKTVAEAEAYVQALLPRLSTIDGIDVGLCVPYTDLQAVRRIHTRVAREVYAQTCTRSPRAPTPARSARRCSLSWTSTASSSGTPSAVSTSTDRGSRALREGPGRARAGATADPLRGREASRRKVRNTERKLRHQVQEGLEKVPTERLGDVVVAYKPIWAIGTGRVATLEQAQDAIAFVRALVADRDREQAERTRILYGGSVKSDGAAELLALEDVDGALVGGASLDPAELAAIVEAARP